MFVAVFDIGIERNNTKNKIIQRKWKKEIRVCLFGVGGLCVVKIYVAVSDSK